MQVISLPSALTSVMFIMLAEQFVDREQHVIQDTEFVMKIGRAL